MGSHVETKECSKEGCESPRSGKKPWCKEHLAEYQRNYQGTIVDMSERRGFARGVIAMRDAVIARFEGLKAARLDGPTAAEIVKQMQLIDGEIQTPEQQQRKALIRSLQGPQ